MRQLKLPDPGEGQNYLIVKMDAELVDKAASLLGPYEDELTAKLEDTVRTFIRERPIALAFQRAD